MAFVPMKCPSCGADISLDDSKEFGFCQFCGTKILNSAIQRLRVEYSGDPMSVTYVNNTTNTQNITNVAVDNRQPGMVVEKPKIGLAVGGVILIIFGLLFLFIAFEQNNSSGFVLTAILIIGGALCLLVFIRQCRYYDMAMKNAINQNNVTNRS